MRLDIQSGPPGVDRAQDHTTVAFIRALSAGEGEPAMPYSLPVEARTHQMAGLPDTQPLAWRYYTWQQSPTTIDVLAVRSAAVHRQPALREEVLLDVRTRESLIQLAFDNEVDYGFARLRYEATQAAWLIDPAYQLDVRWQGAQPVEVEGAGVPVPFVLEQNTPNPFGSTTEIRFTLPQATHVTLVVYDLLGREVARLIDERRLPGSYTERWDARTVASGVYLYRLTAGASVQTRRMMILR